MFCLFSPSWRGKLILFMYGCDKCNDSKSKSMIFFHWIYESLMWNGTSSIFSLFNLKKYFKINRINSPFCYSWNHPYSVKNTFRFLKLLYLIISGSFEVGASLRKDTQMPLNHPKNAIFKNWLIFHDYNPFHMLRSDLR